MLAFVTGVFWSIILVKSHAAFHRPDIFLLRDLDKYASIDVGPKTRHCEPIVTRNPSPSQNDFSCIGMLSTTYKFYVNQISLDNQPQRPSCPYIIMSTEDQSDQQLVLSRQLAHELIERKPDSRLITSISNLQYSQFPPTIIIAIGNDRAVHFMTKSLGMHVIFRDAESGNAKFANGVMPPRTASFREAARSGIQLLIIPQWLAFNSRWPKEIEELTNVLSGLCDDFLVASFLSS